MKDELDHYGEALVEYVGEGTLETAGGDRYNCSFNAAQLHSARIILLCTNVQSETGTGNPATLTALDKIKSFVGRTESGYSITVGGELISVNGYHTWGNGGGVEATYFAGSLTARSSTENVEVAELRYGMTNLELEGRYVTLGSATFKRSLRVALGCVGEPSVLCAIVRAPDYDTIRARMRARKDAARTAEVVFRYEIESTPRPGFEALDEIARRLGYVLSAARGTKVQWIYREQRNSTAEVIESHHIDHVTKRFMGTLAPIPAKVDWTIRNERFIERGYTAYCARSETYQLDILIDALGDAKAEGDYVEMRGVKLAVGLEALKHAFSSSGPTGTEFILPPEEFQGHAEAIAAEAQDLLVRRGVSAETAKRLLSVEKLLGLNRASFRSLLTKTAKSVGLRLDNGDVELFIASRNSLVHTGRFYCTRVEQGVEATVPPPKNLIEEYFFDVYFLDRILLAILNYDDAFVDARHREGPLATLAPPTPPQDAALPANTK